MGKQMCLGGVVQQAACCAGKACCEGFWELFGACLGVNSRQQARLSHVLLLIVSLVATIVVLRWLPGILQPLSLFINCPDTSGGGLLCLGVSSIYRISIALVTVFLFTLLCSMGKDKAAKIVNEACWGCKIVTLLFVFFGLFFVDNSYLESYVSISRVVSFVFILFFIIMLIDLCYTWGEVWIRRYDEGQSEYKWYLILSTLAIYGTCGYFIYKSFYWFTGENCGANLWIILGTILQIILVAGISVSGFAANGSLLTSAGISIVITFFNIAALGSDDRKTCNSFWAKESNEVMLVEIGVATALIIASMLYITLATDQNSSQNVRIAQELSIKVEDDDEYEDEEYQDESGEKKKRRRKKEKTREEQEALLKKAEEDELTEYKGTTFIMFHLIMLLSAFYVSMLLTNWGSSSIRFFTTSYYVPNATAYWIKFASGSITSLLYIWTMFAPILFPDRQFQ
eukprot:TRINITY_DN6190_c0_g2_i2.p1 TRINITY_DN6190_c0_g2~~TRINITY_DN6190_c0_g2_i2.p1  ORF type:complete len:456 (-),score=127.34 TRINITY_DN6190_c0_g2_i2:168-1535(-)